jgi:ElaB/YqjD/DUF883 family membrane-anchored ribosome-binding protein
MNGRRVGPDGRTHECEDTIMSDPLRPTGAPGAAGDHTLRPDPLGKADPLHPAGAAGEFGLRPDPEGRHDPLPHASSATDYSAKSAGTDAADKAADLADRAREKLSGLADDIHDKLGGSADAARERAGAVYDEARERAGEMHRRHMRRLDDLTVQGIEGLERGRNSVERFVEGNPLLVGVVGVAAGLLLGALLPRTRQEDRNIGPYADEVRDQGLRYAREMTHRGREFVQTALDPDNLNAAVRKAAEATDEATTPPAGERTQHNL